MKRIIIFTLVFFITLTTFSQAIKVEYSKYQRALLSIIPIDKEIIKKDIYQYLDENFTKEFQDSLFRLSSANFLLKLDANGNIVFIRESIIDENLKIISEYLKLYFLNINNYNNNYIDENGQNKQINKFFIKILFLNNGKIDIGP